MAARKTMIPRTFPTSPSPKRTLLLALRRRVKVWRKWNDEYAGDSTVRSTCRSCGHVQLKVMRQGPAGKGPVMSEEVVLRLVRYWSGASGTSAVCPVCSKKLADEKYPLSPG